MNGRTYAAEAERWAALAAVSRASGEARLAKAQEHNARECLELEDHVRREERMMWAVCAFALLAVVIVGVM